ncbi:hypothetical protein [Uliginosibacterium sp. H1]|uniref:hypothetical protein n=1 Tax=Uliginosibacterium sp. H1 TaxID=3114757 RepID=UPI002E192320|nr:hypothetical protein [Uliginosibacterium sp. H1]
MNKLLLVVYENEAGVEAGMRKLKDLHFTGDLTLYSVVRACRQPDRALRLEAPLWRDGGAGSLGLAAGGLAGAGAAGPVGIVVGAAAGALAGSLYDTWRSGLPVAVMDEVAAHLRAGEHAIVAEVYEPFVMPVDEIVGEGARLVLRFNDGELVDHQAERAIDDSLRQWRALQAMTAADRRRDDLRLRAGRDRLESHMRQAQRRVARLQRELGRDSSRLTVIAGFLGRRRHPSVRTARKAQMELLQQRIQRLLTAILRAQDALKDDEPGGPGRKRGGLLLA